MKLPHKILVSGGTGYIGAHVVIELLQNGYQVDIVDNLSNSSIDTLDQIQKITHKTPTFHNIDLTNHTATIQLFEDNDYDAIIHLAGLKAVSESVNNPLKYYRNNITITLNLLECAKKHNVTDFIFSSSATVYGNNQTIKYSEDLPVGNNISSPYGKTKYMIEEILKDLSNSWANFRCVSLRYFNPIGNHPSGLIGENPKGIPNNLLPFLVKVAKGELPILSIYGNDYPTPDGTCLRDYIHVVDLAKGHIAALNYIRNGFSAYNLGTGTTTSVLDILHAFENASGQSIPYKFAPRRAGDLPEYYADPSLAQKELNWRAELSVQDALNDTVTFLKNIQYDKI